MEHRSYDFPDGAVTGSIIDRFAEISAQYPDSVAISSPSGAWTYQELGALVRRRASEIGDRLANAKQRAGLPPVVALHLDHDGPLVATALSVLAAGAVLVLIDPLSPESVAQEVVAEAGPLMMIVDHTATEGDASQRAANLITAAPGCALLTLDEMSSSEAARESGSNDWPGIHRTPDDPALLAFTSGTSGVSKGAIVTHGVIMNLVRGATRALSIGPGDRMPMLFPTSLAVAAYPMFLPLLNGGTLATLDVRSVGLAPIGEFLERERITLAYMAPTVVRFLVDSLEGRAFPDLRMIALGGEMVDAEVFGLVQRLFTPDEIANGFGTTETGVIALFRTSADTDVDGFADGVVPTGFAVPDVELSVVDAAGAPAATGVSGEIIVTSPYMFAGYWGHEELSAAVLSPDPQGRPGWFQYRTGDLGRLSPDGALVVLGRVDTKVKIRGRFVVLGDVERDVLDIDGVVDAAVTEARVDGVSDLVGHVVWSAPSAAEDQPADPLEPHQIGERLRTLLLERREAYRVPSRWIVHDEFPRLPNGKLDRRVLAAAGTALTSTAAEPVDEPDAPADSVPPADTVSPANAALSADAVLAADAVAQSEAAPQDAALQGEAAPPQDPAIRRAVSAVWSELFRPNPVGPDSDFAAMGGDSLLAAQMLVMVEQRTGYAVPMSALLRARTLSQVCAEVERLAADTAAPGASAARAGQTTVALVQEGNPDLPRLWFVHDLQGSAYRVRHLARHLGPDQSVWSFESPLLAGRPNRFDSLDEFAAVYVADLIEAQPDGPIWLGGYSFGGICAYEMARQLVRAGREVAWCGIVDVGPGYRGPGWGDRHPPFRPWFGVAKPPEPGTGVAESIRYYADMLRDSPARFGRHWMVRSGIAERVDPKRFARDLETHGAVRPEWRLWYAWDEHWKLAAKAWDRSHTYDGPVELFWANVTPAVDDTMGWAPLVRSVEVVRFDGDHDGILEPRGAAALAEAMRRSIDARIADRSN